MGGGRIEQYRRFIRDKFTWLYIFGKEKPRFDDFGAFQRYINNTVNLTFIYVLSCVRDMYMQEEDIEERKRNFNPNARRAVKNIDRIYNGLDVSFELIIYILLDLQFDLALGEASCLKRYIPGISEKFKILDYSPGIMHWMSSSRPVNNMSLDDMEKQFQELILALPFLRSVELKEEDGEVFFESTADFDTTRLYTDCKIYIQDCGRNFYRLFFLERVEAREHALSLYYTSPDYTDKYLVVYHDGSYPANAGEDDDVSCILTSGDDLQALHSRITGTEMESLDEPAADAADGIRSIYTVNYKYLKNLSLAIADELGSGDKITIRENFLRKYGINPQDDVDLDSVIIIKLIEKTPSTVLYDLFSLDSGAFHSVIRNLYRRFNCRISFKYVDFSTPAGDFTALNNYITRSFRSESQSAREKERPELQANYIISMILSNSRSSARKAERMGSEIDRIQTRQQLQDAQTACAKALVRLYCFYRGVLAYGRKKLEYDADHYDRMPSDAVIAKTQRELHECFLQAARKAFIEKYAERIAGSSTGAGEDLAYTIRCFLELVQECEADNEHRRALKCVLGRKTIVDNSVLGLTPGLAELEGSEQINRIIDILEFLNTGSYADNEGAGDFNSSIYPTTGLYKSNSESSDQCRVAIFSLRIDVSSNGKYDYMKNINVLSEFSYQINEYYYCLPNITRSNNSWWIDPLIIKASDFDEIFPKEE